MARRTLHLVVQQVDIGVRADGGRVTVFEPTRRGYLPDGSSVSVKGRYHWGDTVAVDALTLHATTGDTLAATAFTYRRDGGETAELEPGRDGWFTLSHIVLPDRAWVYAQMDDRKSIIWTYDDVWYADGGSVWEMTGGKTYLRGVQALLDHGADGMTVSMVEADRFLLSDITDALDSAFAEGIGSMLGGSGCAADICSATTLLHAANLIAHHVRTGMLAEAQRVSEIAYRYAGNADGGEAKAVGGCFRTLRNGCGCNARVTL